MNVKSRFARCAMLAVSPVNRLSMPTTEWPRSRSASERCDPMKPAAPVMTIRLESMPVESSDDGQPHDLDVEADRPVFDVVEIVLDALFERRVAAPAVHLRPPGDPRFDLVAEHVLRDAVLELLDEIGPLRPWTDQRHVAAKHVPELRELVEIELPQPPPDRRASRIIVSRPHRAGVVFGPRVHRAELVDVEGLAVEPHALLGIENGAGRGPLDDHRDEREQRR